MTVPAGKTMLGPACKKVRRQKNGNQKVLVGDVVSGHPAHYLWSTGDTLVDPALNNPGAGGFQTRRYLSRIHQRL